MLTITRNVFINIFQTEHFSAANFAMGYEKSMSFLVIPKSSKVWKKVEKYDWAPLKERLLPQNCHFAQFSNSARTSNPEQSTSANSREVINLFLKLNMPPQFCACLVYDRKRLTCVIIHIQIPLTGYVDLIWHSTTQATASWSNCWGYFEVPCNFCDRSTVPAVATAYPQSTLNGTPTAAASAVLHHMRPTLLVRRNLDVYFCNAWRNYLPF